MDYYLNIKEKLLKNEVYKRVKDYSKNRNDLLTYYEVGKLLFEAGRHYGENIIKKYSDKLTAEIGIGYNTSSLKRMRQFYYLIEKGAALRHQLTWTHYKELLPLKDVDKINYYIGVAIDQNLSYRKLSKRIKSKEYERLSSETKKKLIKNKQLNIEDLVPNPIIIKNASLNDNITEYALKQTILDNLDEFLLQLGDGFTYVGSEYKIKLGNKYNYIDLLLFNYKYNCFVVIELKVTELKKEHMGQVKFYMNYIDTNLKNDNHNMTIGIIICKDNNKYVIKYCSDNRIISREYKFV